MGADITAGVWAVPEEAEEIRIPSVLRCGLLILTVRMSLKILGYHRTIRWIRRRVQTVPVTESVNTDLVQAAERAVAVAGAFYPGRALCLEQSLTLYHLLRRQRVGVRYCQGVRCHP